MSTPKAHLAGGGDDVSGPFHDPATYVPKPHSIREREDELREEFWAVAGDDLGSVATTSVARALTGLVRLLASTEEQLEAAQKALRDFAEHGVRHDLNPTRKVPTPDSFWLTYIDRIDKAIRERARAALVSTPASRGDDD